MRTSRGPDISEFQNRVSAVEASLFEAVSAGRGGSSAATEPSARPDEASLSNDDVLEPYHPAMLPGPGRPGSILDTRPDTRIDRYSALLGGERESKPERPATPLSAQSLSPERLQRRESLLKKPLDSLFKR